MRKLLLFIFCFVQVVAIAQQTVGPKEQTVGDDHGVYVTVEKMPQFPGGTSAIMEFVSNNIVHPQADMQGLVVVRFVVNEKGKVEEPVVVRSVHPLLDSAAVDVVRKLPDFVPGEQGGEFVPVYYNLPIRFR